MSLFLLNHAVQFFPHSMLHIHTLEHDCDGDDSEDDDDDSDGGAG
jgi:hypothetical protein